MVSVDFQESVLELVAVLLRTVESFLVISTTTKLPARSRPWNVGGRDGGRGRGGGRRRLRCSGLGGVCVCLVVYRIIDN